MPPRRAPVVRADRVLANPPNNERLRRGRRQREEDVEEVAQPPAVRGRYEERGPNWTLDSDVTDVLLRRYGGRLDISVDDFFTRYSRTAVIRHGKGGDQLASFFDKPLQYVIAEGFEGVKQWISYQCFWAADKLIEGGIATPAAWRNATEEDKKNFTLPVRRMLDTAVGSARRREALTAQSVNGRVIEGVYDSVFNATWSHVFIGDATQPLRVRRVGLPDANLMWSDGEVNVVPTAEEVAIDPPEQVEGLELLCLTSEGMAVYTISERGTQRRAYSKGGLACVEHIGKGFAVVVQ